MKPSVYMNKGIGQLNQIDRKY